jgi:hypothetical protein
MTSFTDPEVTDNTLGVTSYKNKNMQRVLLSSRGVGTKTIKPCRKLPLQSLLLQRSIRTCKTQIVQSKPIFNESFRRFDSATKIVDTGLHRIKFC